MFGLPMPPRKPEPRKPKYWLARVDYELYFVNDSHEILDMVSGSYGGFQTCADDVNSMSSEPGNYPIYRNVMPREAVKIDEFDPIFDSDFLIQEQVSVTTSNGERTTYISPVSKGSIGETVLLWNTDELGKGVWINGPEEERTDNKSKGSGRQYFPIEDSSLPSPVKC